MRQWSPRRAAARGGTTLMAAALFVVPARAQAPAQAGADLEELAWLAGCWRMEVAGRTTDEVWMAPSGGLMMGMSRTVIEGVVAETERLTIRVREGRLEYVADPSGQSETVFTAVPSDGPEWVFANEGHDFPQRIVYRRLEPGSMEARIEGTVDGRLRRVSFPMARVPCRRRAGPGQGIRAVGAARGG